MSKKLITVKCTSYEGDSEFSLVPKEALAKIKQLETDENKWLTINGKMTNTEFLTEEDLIQADSEDLDIFMFNALAGGNSNICSLGGNRMENKTVEINFDVDTTLEKDSIYVKYKDEKYVKTIDIFASKKGIFNIVHDRENIVKAIERKLDEFAEREVDAFKTALNV